MSIEEKKKPLEFTFVPDDVQGDAHLVSINVVYSGDNCMEAGLFPVTIEADGGQKINCPVEFFQEVVEFLTQKGVIEPVLSRTVNNPGSLLPTLNSGDLRRQTDGIPLPQIERKSSPSAVATVGDALASFDITSEAPHVTAQVVDKVTKAAELPQGPVIGVAPGVGEVVATPVINRPVIRSRVTGDDPQSAEKEAAAIRAASGKTKSNFKRTD